MSLLTNSKWTTTGRKTPLNGIKLHHQETWQNIPSGFHPLESLPRTRLYVSNDNRTNKPVKNCFPLNLRDLGSGER